MEKCGACGEEDFETIEVPACCFGGCVHYVNQLEEVLRLLEECGDWRANIPLRYAVRKAVEMGKVYGRPLYTRTK